MSHFGKSLLVLLAAGLAAGCPAVTAPPAPAPTKVAPAASPTAATPPVIETGPADSGELTAGASGASSAAEPDAPGTADAGAANNDAADAAADPLDLTRYYAMKAERFDAARQYPWPAVPRGSQTFAGVPFEIGGMFALFGEENAKRGLTLPGEITGIEVGRPFDALYICHATFFEAPPGTPICEVRFQYDDGTTDSDHILYGSDARDWFIKGTDDEIGPSGKRSTLAWAGEGLVNDRPQRIRFFLTVIANPHPEKTVQTIDLVSTRSPAASCILAMTTGKAGLIHPSRPTRESEE